MTTITVAARKRDPNAFGVQKYSNQEGWNVPEGCAPNGVSATRFLRKTTPDITKLSPLAVFLIKNCPPYVAGRMPAFNHANRVQCYNGKTQADMMRADALLGRCNGSYWVGPARVQRAQEHAENVIKMYNLDNQPAKISDWLFDIIEPDQTDEDYWDKQADNIIAHGITRVVVGENEWSGP